MPQRAWSDSDAGDRRSPASSLLPRAGAAGRVGCGGPKARSWQSSWPARPRGAWRAARTAPALIVFAGAGRQVGTHVPHRAGPRACRLSPRSCPASSAFFPSHPSLLGTGMDPVPPSPWGAGGGGGPRCAGACSACAECRGERCPWALPSPCPSASTGREYLSVPLPSGCSRRAGGRRGGRETAATAGAPWLGAWGSSPVSLGCRGAAVAGP